MPRRVKPARSAEGKAPHAAPPPPPKLPFPPFYPLELHLHPATLPSWENQISYQFRQAPGSIGWKKVLIDPYFPDDMDWAKGFFDSPNGRIEVSWKRKDGKVEVTVKAKDTKMIMVPEPMDIEWNIQKLDRVQDGTSRSPLFNPYEVVRRNRCEF